MDKIQDETPREPYEAPTIEDVPLRGDEQLLASCKRPGRGSGPGTFNCFTTRGPCRSPVGS